MVFKKFEKISKYNTTTIHRKVDHISKHLAVKYKSQILYCKRPEYNVNTVNRETQYKHAYIVNVQTNMVYTHTYTSHTYAHIYIYIYINICCIYGIHVIYIYIR